MSSTEGAAPATEEAGEAFYGALAEDDPEELYDNAPCGYLSTLPDGTIVKVNATFLTWTGFRREDLTGKRRFQSLFVPGDRIFYETHFAPLLLMQGRVREIAIQLVCASGALLPVLINSVLKRNAAGEPAIIRVALFDATERRQYEQELVFARRLAEESEARATTLAKILQASFLPAEITPFAGLDIGAAYRPAGDGTAVGGDFYDVIDTGGGTCGVVIGDVCGKGAPAAAITSLLRYAALAEALRSSDPSQVLTALNRSLLRHRPDDMCTALFLLFVPLAEGTRVTMAAGGHELPLLLRANGRVETIGQPGTMLGAFSDKQFPNMTATLAPGDLVLLFTDGVTEARRQQEFFGEERIHDLLRQHSTLSAQEIADKVVAATVDFQLGNARDDIAVVVVRAV